ncbi:hypothetical protein N0V95_010199, partial [Ascochyta clinopodiicola]
MPCTPASAFDVRNLLAIETDGKALQQYAISDVDFRKSLDMGFVDDSFDRRRFDPAFVLEENPDHLNVLIS